MKRWQIIIVATAVVLAMVVILGYRIGVQMLHGNVVAALGPGSRLTELKVNWFTIELIGLRIDAPKGWPAARTFEAERVIITPDLRSLVSHKVRIFSIVVEGPYLSILRNPGKLMIVPTLTQRQRESTTTSQE